MPAEKKRRVLAVIFDLDGTLIDTEPLYQRFWVEAARQMGYPMEKHHALMLRSLSPLQAEPLLRREVAPDFDYHGVRALRRQIMEAYTDQHGVRPKPGMEETLRELHDMGIRIGLATATPEERARKYLRGLGQETLLDAIACVPMVEKGKPWPDVYLLALRQLGLKPEDCLAVEDSPTGIRAAVNAGIPAVMIPDLSEPDEQVRSLCLAVLPTLPELIPLIRKMEGNDEKNPDAL